MVKAPRNDQRVTVALALDLPQRVVAGQGRDHEAGLHAGLRKRRIATVTAIAVAVETVSPRARKSPKTKTASVTETETVTVKGTVRETGTGTGTESTTRTTTTTERRRTGQSKRSNATMTRKRKVLLVMRKGRLKLLERNRSKTLQHLMKQQQSQLKCPLPPRNQSPLLRHLRVSPRTATPQPWTWKWTVTELNSRVE